MRQVVSNRPVPRVAVLLLAALASAAVLPGGASAQDSKLSTVDLVQTDLTLPAKVVAGKRFVVVDIVENVGDTSAPTTITGFCLSQTDSCGPAGLKLAARRVPPLPSGASHKGDSPLTIPESVPPGTYFFVVTANANKDVEERTRDNNVRAAKVEVEARRK